MHNKFKKIIVILVLLLLITGCVNINSSSVDEIINVTLNSKYELFNQVNRGYKYYLPREMESSIKDDCNEIIKSKYYDYYLYVDLVSYYNNIEENYQVDDSIYISKLLNDKGILNVSKMANGDYVLQVVYNYSKIEIKVKYEDINEAISNSLVILSSIQYNRDVISKLVEDNQISGSEEEVQVFNINDSNNDYLEVDDTYTGEDSETEYDPDVINK